MKNQVRALMVSVSLLILIAFVVVIINQTAGIVGLAREMHPLLGTAVLWGLFVLYGLLVFAPVYIFLTMPKALLPPESEDSPEYEVYRKRLINRLRKNVFLTGTHLNYDNRQDIDQAFDILKLHANAVIKSSASIVFITTAISQNGRLDAIMVLLAQIRLIWQVAHIYHQRPSIRELVHLYANVAATAFIVSSLEDLDIEDQLEPVIGNLFGVSVLGGIPGAAAMATFLSASLVDGAANALLTLRIGVLTRRFFSFRKKAGRAEERHFASLEAGKMLGGIVMSCAGIVTEAIFKASKKQAGAFGNKIKGAAKKSTETVTEASKKSARIC